jgi:hypothetical protein
MKTEEVIDWFHREPFKCNAQTTLIRARNGVLMTKQNISGADIYRDDGKEDRDYAVTGREAKDMSLREDPNHHLGRAYQNPNDFFADDDLTRKDWVPLVVAIPDSVTKRVDDGTEGNQRWLFIGSESPGSWSSLFNSHTLFARRDANWAYDKLYKSCVIQLPTAPMHGVRIPARARTVDPMDILLRIFHKVFVDVCGTDMAERNWQLGWAHYLTNNCAVRVNARNLFGAVATQYLNSPELKKLETTLEAIKKAVQTEEPLEYVDRWADFSTSLGAAYSAEQVSTDTVGHGANHVLSHIVEDVFPFTIRNGYYNDRDLYKVVDRNWKTRCVHFSETYRNDYESACRETQRFWDGKLAEDSAYQPNECYMGMRIPSFTKLRANWSMFVDLFERLGFTEPKPFGFSLCDENEESLAVLRSAAVSEMSDPSATIEDAAEAEAESTMTLLG